MKHTTIDMWLVIATVTFIVLGLASQCFVDSELILKVIGK